jgi:hypothetical protein
MGSFDRNSLITGLVVGLIVGLLLGMVLFWGLFPVQWTDANSYDLSPTARAEYMALVADSYKLDRDPAKANGYLSGWNAEEKQQAVADAVARYESEGQFDKAQDVKDLGLVLGVGEAPPVVPDEATPSFFERLRVPCMIFFVVLLVLVLGWIGLRVAMRRRDEADRAAPMAPIAPPPPVVEDWDGVGQPPLGHFFTTYQLGEDTYDESFSIETPMNEFLGECGVGISETIGMGEPDKVTAFEVWLFDKSDIRTVTKVLMSDYAYGDDALRAKLASKGEAVLAEPGVPFTLETSSLQVRVDVTELIYGEGELPPLSFFSKLTVELVATAKTAETDASTF